MTLENFDLKQVLKSNNFWGKWDAIEDSSKVFFNNELLKEVAYGHILYETSVNAIAHCIDDVLYQIVDSEKVATAHLTFCKSKDTPPYPISKIYDCIDDWYEQECFANIFKSKNLTHFEEIIIGYAMGVIADSDFEKFIYESNEKDLTLNEQEYFELISANFQNKSEVLTLLNNWYRKDFKENCWFMDLFDLMSLIEN